MIYYYFYVTLGLNEFASFTGKSVVKSVKKVADASTKGLTRVPEVVIEQSAADLPFSAPVDAKGVLWKVILIVKSCG